LTVLQIFFLFVSKARPDVLGFATDISTGRLFELTNQKRLENGIPPLVLNQELSNAAAGKAQDMFGNNYWAHISPSGKTPWDFIIGANYQYIYAGENLAKDFQDADGVVSAWMNSPSHRDNLLQAKYKDVGFAIINGRLSGEETTLVVQIFGTKSSQQNSNVPSSLIPTPPTTQVVRENPAPTIQIMAVIKNNQTGNNLPKSNISNTQGVAVKKNPMINLFSLSKDLTLGIVALLILVLVVDAYFASKHKIVRISGSNFAHILLLTSLFATLLILNRGSII